MRHIKTKAEGPLSAEEGIPVIQMGYEFYPETLEQTIRYAMEKTGCPVIVTEKSWFC